MTLRSAGVGDEPGTRAGAGDQPPFLIRDLQALVLHLLGLDPWKLTYLYQGLQQRLIDVEGKAKIHKQLLA